MHLDRSWLSGQFGPHCLAHIFHYTCLHSIFLAGGVTPINSGKTPAGHNDIFVHFY